MFKLEESLWNHELRGQTRKLLFAEAFMGTWSNMHTCGTKVGLKLGYWKLHVFPVKGILCVREVHGVKCVHLSHYLLTFWRVGMIMALSYRKTFSAINNMNLSWCFSLRETELLFFFPNLGLCLIINTYCLAPFIFPLKESHWNQTKL